MRLVPVLDIKNRLAVHAVGGRRQDYRPICSPLATSPDPLVVARALQSLGLSDLYIADLDAIAGQPPAPDLYTALRRLGLQLWLDAGVRNLESSRPLVPLADRLVVGLETVAGPAALAEICAVLGSGRTIFSLDLRDGMPLGELSRWPSADAWSIAREAIAAGSRRVLVLDLARVGAAQGAGTEKLCARLASTYPEVEVMAGGGIRDLADVHRFKDAGVQTLLVGTALHKGAILPADIISLASSAQQCLPAADVDERG